MTLPESASNYALPLAGLRVLEFSQNIWARAPGLVLADLGADVIKIEPRRTAITRAALSASPPASSHVQPQQAQPRGRSEDREGRALVHRLAASADVVLENFAPGTMERLGCGYEPLRRSIPASSIAR